MVNPSQMASLLDKRLIVVTGKGGVGKSTVAAALGLLAAGQGKRTIVCEVAEQERMASVLGGGHAGYQETEVEPGLFAMSIDPELAREEWLRYQLRSGALAGLLGHSRIFQLLAAAAPGLSELVTVGKIWELAQRKRKKQGAAPYDLVIADAPSSGHGLAMLRAPNTFADVARVGPIHRQAKIIHHFIADARSTGVLMVALPEEMPVNETLEFGGRLREEMGMAIDRIVVNGVYPERFSGTEAERLAALDGRISPEARAAVRAALSEHRRARAQRSQLRRLRRGAEAPVSTLPYLFEPDLGRAEIEELARKL
jgi:anion-transporting  ArsA/GET3 family ATPase